MCWTLEVSIAAGVFSWAVGIHTWRRNHSVRDRWMALFILVFSCIQWAEVVLWWDYNRHGHLPRGQGCSKPNYFVTAFAIPAILAAEPASMALGMMFGSQSHPAGGRHFPTTATLKRAAAGVFAVGVLTFAWLLNKNWLLGYPQPTLPCSIIGDISGRLQWFSVRLHPRFFSAFLASLVLPVAMYMRPLPARGAYCGVLALTWLYTLATEPDSFGSLWCFLGNVTSVVLLVDPYVFPAAKQRAGDDKQA